MLEQVIYTKREITIKNFIEIEEACNYPFVDTNLIRIILGGVSKSRADKFRMELEEKLDKEMVLAMQETDKDKQIKALASCYYYNDTRPHRVPIKRVLEKAHIDLDYVRKEANKMRRARLIENREYKGVSLNENNTIST